MTKKSIAKYFQWRRSHIDAFLKPKRRKRMRVAAKISPMKPSVTKADYPDEDDDLEVEFSIGQEMPGCCAIQVLGECNPDDGPSDTPLHPKFQSSMEEALRDEFDGAECGLMLYTVTQKQTTESAALIAAGFEQMAVFKNPNTDNIITLYGKLLNQPKKR